MQLLTILTSALVGAAVATSQREPNQGRVVKRHDYGQDRMPPSTYYGISLNIKLTPLDQPARYGRAPVEINVFNNFYSGMNASQIIFGGPYSYIDNPSAVRCQAFSDTDGVKPLGGSFSAAKPLELGPEPVPLGAMLCWITGEV